MTGFIAHAFRCWIWRFRDARNKKIEILNEKHKFKSITKQTHPI